PVDALKTMEVYDTAAPTGNALPPWLKETTFSGMAWRDDVPLLVAARQFPRAGAAPRTVVFVQPMDEQWIAQIEDHSGMTVRVGTATDKRRSRPTGGGVNINLDDKGTDNLILESAFRKIIWLDVTTIPRWTNGQEDPEHELVTTIINPFQNLFHYYFGAAAD